MKKASPIPSSAGSRLLRFGQLAGGLAAGMVAEGARRLATGRMPAPGDLLLTPGNAARLAERLSELRGAAMKVGQLLSMEAGDLVPRELSDLLARLRDDAHQMPLGQVAGVLERAWGEDWPKRFERFHFQPLAAASIGQVHDALTRDGRRLAIKIQYPGVRTSIDSDVDQVARLLSLVRAVPGDADLAPLLAEGKRQLHGEADYLQEARLLEDYRGHLGDHPLFVLPQVVHDWTTREVLTMSYVPGDSLEILEGEPHRTRNRMATELLALTIRELFDWGLVQTDPNFANFRYDREKDRVGLLDFGAVRRYPRERSEVLQRLLTAGVRRDRAAIVRAASDAGYLRPQDPMIYRQAVVSLLLDATEPARCRGEYDFATSDLAGRMTQKVMAVRFEARCWSLPPPDLLFLHRKLGGLYMLCSRLGAQIPVRDLLEPYLVEL
jgi:predicted unusual protein kinase regulating ubiquinone biosynthesis (AarF/ABC1/UbiB family)